MSPEDPRSGLLFFETPEELRAWFRQNHERLDEAWIGYFKKSTGLPSITWEESVDQALCFGWIDGIRKSVDDEAYKVRFTPRRPGSNWSRRNLERMDELLRGRQVTRAGKKAFAARTDDKTAVYSFEQEKVDFPAAMKRRFRKHQRAWKYWTGESDSYRRSATWWVVSAKRAETRERRLATLIEDSAKGIRIKQLRRN